MLAVLPQFSPSPSEEEELRLACVGRTGTLSEPWVVCVRIQTGIRVFFAYQCLLASGTGYLLDLEAVRQANPEQPFHN